MLVVGPNEGDRIRDPDCYLVVRFPLGKWCDKTGVFTLQEIGEHEEHLVTAENRTDTVALTEDVHGHQGEHKDRRADEQQQPSMSL